MLQKIIGHYKIKLMRRICDRVQNYTPVNRQDAKNEREIRLYAVSRKKPSWFMSVLLELK